MLNRRLVLLFAVFVMAFALLGMRLGKLQVADHDKWTTVVQAFVHRVRPVETYRGKILDRFGRVLAEDVPADELAIDYRAMNYDDRWLAAEAKERLIANNEWAGLPDRAARLRKLDETKAQIAREIDGIPEAIAKVCNLPAEEIRSRMDDIRARIRALREDHWTHTYERDAAKRAANGDGASSTGMEAEDATLDAAFRMAQLKEEQIAHTIVPNISPEVATYFRQHAAEYPGLVVPDVSNRRNYPYGECLGQITGSMMAVDGPTQKKEPFAFPAWLVKASEGNAPENELGTLGGYLPGDRMGEGGAEKVFEELLRGARGAKVIDLTDSGDENEKPTAEMKFEPGKDVRLTLDADLQQDIYNALKDPAKHLLQGKDEKDHFVGLVVLSLDGEVLAMVSDPTYDPNKMDQMRSVWAQDRWRTPLFSRAFHAASAPGSTIKPLLASAALTEKVITPSEKINCTGHLLPSRLDIFRCDKLDGHGPIAMVDAIAESCNVYFYTVGGRMGEERLTAWYGDFGLGKDTGMELSEARGALPKPPPGGWSAGDTEAIRNESWEMGIGQGQVAATPLQMANAYATLLRGGAVWKPRILADAKPEISQAFTLSTTTLGVVREGMEDVVKTGTAKAAFKGFNLPVAGKTGTAEVERLVWNDDGTPNDDPDRPLTGPDGRPKMGPDGKPMYRQIKDRGTDAWFIGYAPANNPKYIVAAIMEWGGHGGAYAAPMVRETLTIMEKRGYLPKMDVPEE